MIVLLVVLQAIQVVILWLHGWVPAPPLNDVAAVRAANSTPRLVLATLMQSVPYTIGLVFSAIGLTSHFPGWLWCWLWISYGILFVGELSAWWVPYLVKADPEKVVRYRAMFGATHAVLPERNGITPNTLHLVLHSCTLLTLIVLARLTL